MKMKQVQNQMENHHRIQNHLTLGHLKQDQNLYGKQEKLEIPETEKFRSEETETLNLGQD